MRIKWEKAKEWFLDTTVNVLTVLVLVLFIRTFLVSPFQVSGTSMQDSLLNGDYILIDKLSYYFSEPKHGDVVVFRPPTSTKEYYVKRIIGVPGDTVKIESGEVFVNGEKIDEPFLNRNNLNNTALPIDSKKNEFIVKDDAYFVLGDNRGGSSDSRHWRDDAGTRIPFVIEDKIQGRVWLVLFPLQRAHAVERVEF